MNRQSEERIDIRRFMGCECGKDMGRPGRILIFRDSGGVRAGETWVRGDENRQSRVRNGISRFWGCQRGIDMGRTGRESPRQGENRYFTIQGGVSQFTERTIDDSFRYLIWIPDGGKYGREAVWLYIIECSGSPFVNYCMN